MCLRPGCRISGCRSSSIECAPPPGAAPTGSRARPCAWPFSERLCRHGGIVCGQALMALADTSMVIAILAANRGYRPMTTVDQTTHFMRAVDRVGRAGRRAGGPARAHHEFWPGHAVERHRQQAGGDGLKRVCDAVKPRRRRGSLLSRADDTRRFSVTMAAPWSGSASASPARARMLAERLPDARRRSRKRTRWRAAGGQDFSSGPERGRPR